ncbi:hypothetical protein AOLI_G00269180 [Acnodon oligacanthus]
MKVTEEGGRLEIHSYSSPHSRDWLLYSERERDLHISFLHKGVRPPHPPAERLPSLNERADVCRAAFAYTQG